MLSSSFPFTKNFIVEFGSHSTSGRNLIETFITKLSHKQDNQLGDYKAKWKELMSKVYGERVFNDVKVADFSAWYNIQFSCSFETILYAIQTYYAIIVKFITNELIRNKFVKEQDSFATKLDDSKNQENLFSYMNFIENGGYCSEFIATNFLDGVKLFKWYLYSWDQITSQLINSLLLKVRNSQFLSNEMQEDSVTILNEFYKNLLPQKVRKFLGEIYTPVWLADYVIEQSSWDGNAESKVIDPSCGSGIFLILFIDKICSKYENVVSKSQLLQQILKTSAGLDINPLAVLTARTNFLIRIIDLVQIDQEPFLIPIAVGDVLESTNKEKMFDYVIGNPPWINWEFLPELYKKDKMTLWKEYGLFSAIRMKKLLGEAKYDVSAVFIYKCIDYLLKDQGILHFIIPLTLLRGLPGQGFRKNYFETQTGRVHFKLLDIQDLSHFQPFSNANTNVGIIKVLKGPETSYPVSYVSWIKIDSFSQNQSWKMVNSKIQRINKYAIKIDSEIQESVNLIILEKGIQFYQEIIPLLQSSDYNAFEGSNTEGLNAVFWITNLQRTSKGILFDNINKSQKKKLPHIKNIPIERELVYPLIRSKNIRKWSYTIDSFIIFTLKYDTTKQLTNIETFQQLYPLTFEYLKTFEQQLMNRSSFKNKSKDKPFYLIYGKEDMKSRFKVVWNRMGSEITAVVTEFYNHPVLGNKPPIPQETIVYLPTDTLEEAHFICAVMNSKLFSLIVSLIHMKGTKGFGTPRILEKVFIPNYDEKNRIHKDLVRLSQHLHVSEERDGNSYEGELNNLVVKLYRLNAEKLKDIIE